MHTVKEATWMRSLKLKGAILRKGMQMNCNTCFALLNCHCSKNDFSKAVEVPDEMKEQGSKPSDSQCVIFIKDLHSKGL